MRIVVFIIFLVIFNQHYLQANPSSYVVNIDNPSFRKLRIAVPKFVIDKDLKKTVAKLAQEGLEQFEYFLDYTGFFKVVNQDAYQGVIGSPEYSGYKLTGFEQVDFQLLKRVGVESLVLVKILSHKEGLRVELRTADVNRVSKVVGKAYIIKNNNDFVEIAKRYIDHILKAYTGKPGIFSSKIVFAGKITKESKQQIYVCDIDGKNIRQITHGNYLHMSPSWGPRGKRILYTSYQKGKPDLYMRSFYDENQFEMTIANHQNLNSGGSFSPNGKYIVYTSSRGKNADLFVIDPRTSKRTPLTANSGLNVDPVFSPDGKWLAYVSGRFGNPHIFRAKLDWGYGLSVLRLKEQKRLTYAGWYNTMPSWSPNSKKIAFSSYEKGRSFDVFVMNADGSNIERLTLGPGDNERPTWTANGHLIVFHSNRIKDKSAKGMYQLYIMDKEGRNQKKIETGFYEAKSPQLSYVNL